MALVLEKPVAAINIVIERPAIGHYREKDFVIKILDEKIIYQRGSFRVVKRWLQGVHPDRGQIIKGLTGWETVEEVCVIKPQRTFEVKEFVSSYQI